jgi:glycerol-3-phosphate acyltransferase PlsY
LHPVVKILIGILLIAAGIYWILYGPSASGLNAVLAPYLSFLGAKPVATWNDFILLLNGALPPLIVLIGIFIVWLEWDEWKIERELAAEEKKEKRRRKR